MSAERAEVCEHEAWERDAAAQDGLCPLCLQREVARVKEKYELLLDVAVDAGRQAEQRAFLDAVQAAGGIGIVAYDVQDVLEALR